MAAQVKIQDISAKRHQTSRRIAPLRPEPYDHAHQTLEGAKVAIQSDIGRLGLDSWKYDNFFDPLSSSGFDVTDSLEKLVEETRLDSHPFFETARKSKSALFLWVSQELVMTNAFSQIVLLASSYVQNVHARAILAEVAYGEHGTPRGGLAKFAHPWLLEQMRSSLELSRAAVSPLPPTISFINRLVERVEDTLEATAFIGVGNERLIEPEYAAVRRCFQELTPTANFEPFLKANIEEDITHSRLCYELANFLITSQEEHDRFITAATEAVASRVTYFDDLLALAQELT